MIIICILASLSQPRCIKRVKSLLDGGHEIVVYGYQRGFYDVNEFPQSVKVHNWGNIKSGTGYFSRFYRISNDLKTCLYKHKNEEVIYYCFSFEAALIMSMFTRKKFFYEISDLIYCYFKNPLLKKLFRNIDKLIIKRSLKTILTSGGFYEYLYGRKVELNDDKIIIQPNKLSTFFLNAHRNVLSVTDEARLRFAYVGAFRYPNTIFRFAKIIGERFPQYDFSFYGDSNLTYLAKELSEKYHNIHYYGKFKNPDDLMSIYDKIDIVTACYDIEEGENERVAEPNKLYEAICFCKPIIVSKHTYLSKKVEELGVGYSIEADKDECIIDFINNLNVSELIDKSRRSFNLPQSEYIDSSSQLLAAL